MKPTTVLRRSTAGAAESRSVADHAVAVVIHLDHFAATTTCLCVFSSLPLERCGRIGLVEQAE